MNKRHDHQQLLSSVVEPLSGLPSPSPRDPLLSPDSHMDAQGYKWVRWRVWLCRLAALLSLGFLLIVFHWRPRLGVLARCCSCPLALADILLIRDCFGQQHVVEVLTEEMEEGSLDLLGELEDTEWRDTVQLYQEKKILLRYYLFEGLRYIWLDRKGAFCRVSVLNEDWTCKDLYGFQKGLSHLEQSSRRRMYGPNLIDVPVKPYMKLLFEEVINPFYVFQLFSITLWMIDNYYIYAICIFIISIVSIFISLYEIRKQSVTLRSMARFVTKVTIRRNSAEECVSSEDLVPGDCIIIPQEGLQLPCDAALLAGECLVNESMLTGESVPVLKTPLPAGERTYSSETERRHTLFCGTQLIQAKGGGPGGSGAVAVVTSTGFFTAKGNLVSSILYPQPTNFRFYQDSVKFLLILGCVALSGTIYSFVVLFRSSMTWMELMIRSLDIVTIAVPPALPAAITTGTIYAQSRLKRQGVFCISPPRINICGKVSVFCFDKTGTLTEDGLDVWGVMEGGPAGFSELVPEPRLLPPGNILTGLACCHTVTLLRDQPLGDPLELKMVESTGWTLEEPEGDGKVLDAEFGGHRVLAVMRPPTQQLSAQGPSARKAVAIVQRFAFSSTLQRMSVVTVARGGHTALAFIKGSPEMVASLCLSETVPAQFSGKLQSFSSEGLRVLALAYKPLDSNTDFRNIERGEVEKDMHFLGLLMMKNLVKPESAKVIKILRLAQLRSVMVTGDNILTAVNVAKSCGMVGSDEKVIFVNATPHTAQSMPTLRFNLEDGGATASQSAVEVITQGLYQGGFGYHLAISGKSFAALCDHFPEYLPKVLLRTTVFARMTPDQKTQLVKELQKLDYRVGMCGDGANDCGALRSADVGVSLSEAEASVASPFTSRTDNITCVPLLIREGRCSLVTSFSLFRYMALYSLIQLCSVLTLYTMKTSMADLQFLVCDIFVVSVLAIVMGRGGPSEELHPRRPPASLITVPVLGSIFIHTCMIILGQLSGLFITMSQDWYIPLNSTVYGAANLPNMENTSVFAIAGFQYIIMAVVVTKGYPHKKPLFYNLIFLGILFVLFGLMSWLVLYPGPLVCKHLEMYNFTDMGFKMLLVAVAALNFVICFVVEVLIDVGILNCLRSLWQKRQSKKLYKRLDVLLSNSPSWPPLNQPLYPTDHTVISLS
ncbi:cation-transporting ATPase 13A2 isoform X2 [Acanthopagrus latus]|uniref:cation-transporting ATPase 13A2 isoform X2 n=1 Tax=Acanthopagrus latus TaxID=8177 RepID=UPI00187C2D65|nr:cation-transporting ATPase 13A2 isoform X2 [Acanthopagrus latus]